MAEVAQEPRRRIQPKIKPLPHSFPLVCGSEHDGGRMLVIRKTRGCAPHQSPPDQHIVAPVPDTLAQSNRQR